ncbi:hypothetical protein [Actinobacillus porcinus]|uniref:hypothetical protein n=1 Tax=Actinobacillus porcinus TaxID=51048 RepID=UPI002A91DE69|nr:hypothetical protein [Actinobacillus porcinus]MDY6216399.1 hypothetical protein [Actinobacillus porcinus]
MLSDLVRILLLSLGFSLLAALGALWKLGNINTDNLNWIFINLINYFPFPFFLLLFAITTTK